MGAKGVIATLQIRKRRCSEVTWLVRCLTVVSGRAVISMWLCGLSLPNLSTLPAAPHPTCVPAKSIINTHAHRHSLGVKNTKKTGVCKHSECKDRGRRARTFVAWPGSATPESCHKLRTERWEHFNDQSGGMDIYDRRWILKNRWHLWETRKRTVWLAQRLQWEVCR